MYLQTEVFPFQVPTIPSGSDPPWPPNGSESDEKSDSPRFAEKAQDRRKQCRYGERTETLKYLGFTGIMQTDDRTEGERRYPDASRNKMLIDLIRKEGAF